MTHADNFRATLSGQVGSLSQEFPSSGGMGVRTPAASKRYRFGLFQADPASGELLRQGERVRLQDLPFRMLILLLEKSGEVVSREELREKLWPADTYVEFDGSLKAALKRLRAALGDTAENPIFIETLPKRGYRFVAPVGVEDELVPVEAIPESSAPTQPSTLEVIVVPPRLRTFPGRGLIYGVAVSVILIASVGLYSLRHRSQQAFSSLPAQPAAQVIAVLPFTNEGAGSDYDYLRYAIANDLVTDLAYVPSITVRPFASTTRYASQPGDLAVVGKELRVTHILAGGFLLDGQLLRVNLELVDVARDQPVWRGEAMVPPQQLVALHDQLASRTAPEMLRTMNISNASTSEIPVPRNAQAFELFLHSLSFPLDPEPNRLATRKLEESVSIDSNYAPAWGELANRYYFDYHYANGGDAAVAKALAAYKRQSELDPDVPTVPTVIRVEQGDLNGAYDQALELVRRRPDLSAAHFGLSYVLRYAGLLEEAGVQCDAALALDPGFSALRSCANPFIQKSDYAHAAKYINLDAKFPYSRIAVQLRTQNTAPILPELTEAARSGFHAANIQLVFFRACLNHAPRAELSKASQEVEHNGDWAHDGEPLFADAEFLAFCGEADGSIRELARSVRLGYCSYPAMDKDPVFDSVRQRQEFVEVRQAAIQCQESFESHRRLVGAADQPGTRKTH